MRVFISWSQTTSSAISLILKKSFEKFFNDRIQFWVSSADIKTGGVSANEIIEALKTSHMGIICLDKSNLSKNWIYFETGFVFGKNYSPDNIYSTIFPIIFDNSKVEDFRKTPFENLQLKHFSKETVHSMLLEINEGFKKINSDYCISPKYFEEQFELLWNILYGEVNNIIKQTIVGDDNMLTQENVVDRISRYNFPVPIYGDVIEYGAGFETHDFYKFLLENASKRIYIFGRKNRKLTDKSFKEDLLSVLKKKIDLRLLYLNPNSSFAQSGVAQDLDDFNLKLKISIKEFFKILKDASYDCGDFCRMYDEQRESEIIIADNVVFYKDLAYSDDGKPLHFTNSKFYVTAINSSLGTKYCEKFERAWKENKENRIDYEFVKSLKTEA